MAPYQSYPLSVYYSTKSSALNQNRSESMAAYGALLSLSHTLRQVLNPPPLNKIIVDQQQIHLLLDKVDFFINFLENYPQSQRNEEIERVERRITDAAQAAEDIIESNVVDQIHAANKTIIDSDDGERFFTLCCLGFLTVCKKVISNMIIGSNDGERFKTLLCQGIQTVLGNFISIEEELPMMMLTQRVEGLQHKSRASTATTSSRSFPGGRKTTTVGLDDLVENILSQLACDESSRRVIPIVGMGGIGKTTLATVVYNHPYIIEYFDFRAWVTVSQEYTVGELLNEINKVFPDEQGNSGDDLGLRLHKKLFGRRYLIVMDDVWDVEAIDALKRFLPRNKNGSRVLVTSRLSYMTDDHGFICKMDFLDEEHSWDLFRKTIFGKEDCPVELVEIGKKIAQGCSGLPLSLVLIGGLLAKSEKIKEHWEHFFARDMTFALNSENDEQVMKILSLSYTHLPVHLKPCFLYLAMFPEDFKIRVSRLVGLWVAEGLIKPTQDKCLEDVAREYVGDLISRNIMLVEKRGSTGNVKSCKLHDRVRNLCITEAAKQEFAYISKLDNLVISPNIETARRLGVSSTGKPLEITIEALESATLNRSWLSSYRLLGNGYNKYLETERAYLDENVKWLAKIINGYRLLKVVEVSDEELGIDFLNLYNLRYVSSMKISSFSKMALCWNLQILFFGSGSHGLPVEIWQMPQLRHLDSYLFIIDPPDDDQNMVVLENLHTLGCIHHFKCSEQVLKRIPNLRKLKILLDADEVENQRLQNLACFKKLESLTVLGGKKFPTFIAFPVSLKKLVLGNCGIPWAYLSIVVGSLPNLEVLELFDDGTKGDAWNPIEGKFCRLKFLKIYGSKLKTWGAEKEHFPCLGHLVLKEVELEEIPMSFAKILTLETIELYGGKESLRTSAKKISEEREELGYEPLVIKQYVLTHWR